MAPKPVPTFPKTPFEPARINQVRQIRERGTYDRDTIFPIIDAALIAHVGFVEDGRPVIIPMVHGRDGDRIFLHGHRKSRVVSRDEGEPVCLTFTHVDGIMFARSVFESSMNYRSAIAYHAIALQHADPATEFDELCAGSADGGTVVTPEIRDGLVVGHQPTGQPHQLDIASRLAFQPATRRDAVQIPIDEKLQQDGRMIARPKCPRRRMAMETKCRQIELIDKEIDDTDQMIFADPVFQPLRKKRRLIPIHTFDEARHSTLPNLLKSNMNWSFYIVWGESSSLLPAVGLHPNSFTRAFASITRLLWLTVSRGRQAEGFRCGRSVTLAAGWNDQPIRSKPRTDRTVD